MTLLRALVAFLLLAGTALAQGTTISNLPAASTLAGNETVPCVQGGTTKKCTLTPNVSPFTGILACDGATDSTAAVSAFDTAGGGYIPRPMTLPATTDYCKTTIARGSLAGPFWAIGSGGRIADSAGNLLGPLYGRITAAPTQLGSYDSSSEVTAFNADFSHSLLAMDFNITGAATLGQPSSGYRFTRNAYPMYGYLYNSSGFNNSATANDGRTNAAAVFWDVFNAGQGDANAFVCNGFVNSTRAGATHFLANPEVACLSGGLASGVDGAYIEAIGDINLHDNNHDIAAFSWVNNFDRNNATGALNVNWVAMRQQVGGTKPIDSFMSFSGPVGIAIDLTGQTYPDSVMQNAALTAAGTCYTAGDDLVPSDGTSDTVTHIRVLTVNNACTASTGGVLTIGVERGGKYSVVPTVFNNMTGGTGTGVQVALTYGPAAAIVMTQNSWLYLNGTNDASVYSTKYPSTAKIGTTRLGFNTTANRAQFLANNTIAWEASATQLTANVALQIGTATQLTLAAGEVGLAKVTASGSAPGAAGLKYEAVCGTNAGTAKLIAYAGTSTTPVTITDNIGSGVTGC